MNQILYVPHKKILVYVLILVFSIISIFALVFYMAYHNYRIVDNKNLSNLLSKSYDISKLYTVNENEYKTIDDSIENQNVPYIMGKLEIPSLDISFPVISEITDELLKISVCRFYGPKRIIPGNICIAGHNYNNNDFFSNLKNTSIGDKIYFTDNYESTCVYTVTENYETSSNDTSCTSQPGDENFEITLVTCNNYNGNRIIIRAKK